MPNPKSKTENPNTSVAMTKGLHQRLGLLAADETVQTGKKVSIRELVERAVLEKWPQLIATLESDPAVAGFHTAVAPDDLFANLLNAAIADGNSAIDQLNGEIDGTLGQQIPLRNLAYYLRRAMNAGLDVASLETLIEAYEKGE